MMFRTLGLGLSVGWLVMAAAPAVGQKSSRPAQWPKQLITDAPAASPPGQTDVSDALDPVEFKPSPIEAYDPERGSTVIVRPPVPPVQAYVPPRGMAMRVQVIDDTEAAPQPVPSSGSSYYAPSPYPVYPSTSVQPGVAYAAPACTYPTLPVYSAPVTTYGPVCVAPFKAPTKVDLLRGALCQLELAGANELVKLLKVEIATEEKRELAEELTRKESELEALKADIEKLRKQVEPGVARQVRVKVQVLDIDLTRSKALDQASVATKDGVQKLNLPQMLTVGFSGASVESPDSDRGWTALIHRKTNPEVSSEQAPEPPCAVDSRLGLLQVLPFLQANNAVKVISEPSLLLESGKRQHFCFGAGAAVTTHPEDETCDFCAANGIELDLLATVQGKNRIRTEISMRHNETTVLPANTTGLESPLPPAIRCTDINTAFDASPGQTFVASIRRHAVSNVGETDAAKAPEGQEGTGETSETKKEPKSEFLRLVLVTPCLVNSASVLPPPAAWAPVSGVAPAPAVGIRPHVLLEPFLKDIEADKDFKPGVVEFGGMKPRYLQEYLNAKPADADGGSIKTVDGGFINNGPPHR